MSDEIEFLYAQVKQVQESRRGLNLLKESLAASLQQIEEELENNESQLLLSAAKLKKSAIEQCLIDDHGHNSLLSMIMDRVESSLQNTSMQEMSKTSTDERKIDKKDGKRAISSESQLLLDNYPVLIDGVYGAPWQIARLQEFYGSEKIVEASKSLNKAVSLAFRRITPRQREAVKHYLGFGRGPDVKNLNTPGHERPWVWTKKFSYVAEKLDCTEQNARKLVERGLSDMRRDYVAALLKRFKPTDGLCGEDRLLFQLFRIEPETQ